MKGYQAYAVSNAASQSDGQGAVVIICLIAAVVVVALVWGLIATRGQKN